MNKGRQIRVKGLVQGVGFRPTVWIVANKLKLCGEVLNDGQGVLIKIYGNNGEIDGFISALQEQCPPLARIDSIEQQEIIDQAPTEFTIVPSKATAAHTGIVPDAATCGACIDDTKNKDNRRYHYPFTNCTHCGPRLSIIKAIPYDRKNTSMSTFILCDECQKEYEHPADRRFHAQPNACPKCGPQVELIPHLKNDQDDINNAINLLKQGKIIAIKGLGGFHLACDASNQVAVQTLRHRKKRHAKPFALMARTIKTIEKYCHLGDEEITLLKSSVAPIVLLKKSNKNNLPDEIAPGQNSLGFMLPYTPLHHLLFARLDSPLVTLVMTSGNSSDIPQCIDNQEALDKLKDIADYWLINNRDIVNRVDDSVVRMVNNKLQVLRRARGYAPTSLPLPDGFSEELNVLACGAELKNTFCLVKDGLAILSQHIGDLKNASTYEDYEKTVSLFQNLYQHKADMVAIDAHPDYLSSQFGRDFAHANGQALFSIQHHHAHIASALAENKWALNQGKVLGIALDGIGYGENDEIWGGEFLLADYHSSVRLGHLQATALLGGSQAMYQPWRNTYAQLLDQFDWQKLSQKYANLEIFKFFEQKPLATMDAMLEKNINSPLASSMGRLFDAVAAAVGICSEHVHYEGQAAIELEALVTAELIEQEQDNFYHFSIQTKPENILLISTKECWQSLLDDLAGKIDNAIISTRFHLGLVDAIVAMVKAIGKNNKLVKINTIVLSGGVFQNKILLENTYKQLTQLKFKVITHSQIPANDGGIALGQAVIALAQQQKMEIKPCV